MKPNLTIRLGIRQDFSNGWNEAEGKAANFVFGPGNVLLTSPIVGNSPFATNNAKWLFSPRVALAWDHLASASVRHEAAVLGPEAIPVSTTTTLPAKGSGVITSERLAVEV